MVFSIWSSFVNDFFAFTAYLVDILFPAIGMRYVELFSAPYHFPNMIWIVTPLIVTLVLMEFYFGRYTKEELGWNTAVGNSLVLIFVSLDLLRFIFTQAYPDIVITHPGILFLNIVKLPVIDPIKFSIAVVIGLVGLWIMLFDFFHILPKKVAFKLSESLPINVIAYLGIVLVYTDLLLDTSLFNITITVLAALLMFISLMLMFGVVHILEPTVKGDKND
ncbi:hypothetical protein ACFLZX_03835 [Nanoarchaeota archaeon]